VSGAAQHRQRRHTVGLVAGGCLAALVLTTPSPAAAGEQSAQAVHDAQWALRALNAEQAWTVTKGEGVTVAVIDSGVDATHPDLVGRVVGGGDFGDGASGDGTNDPGGPRGHGTEVASLVAGTGKNYDGHGLLGLAPQAEILSLGAYRNGAPDPAAVARALRRAVAEGAQVIVTPALPPGTYPAVASAARRAMDADAVLVSGVRDRVGTSATPVRATHAVSSVKGVVTVKAVGRNGQVLPGALDDTQSSLAAPGVQVLAASSDGTYWTGNDSGFAASWVAGTAALVRAAHPDWTAAQTIAKLIDTARRDGARCGDTCGYGVVDPMKAVTDATRPAGKANPLLSAPVPASAAADNPIPAVPSERILLFLGFALGVLLMYVAITAVFIRRQRQPGRQADGP
jgi:subtilisin family serine protease